MKEHVPNLDELRAGPATAEGEALRRAHGLTGPPTSLDEVFSHGDAYTRPPGGFYLPMCNYYTQNFQHITSARAYTPAMREGGLPLPDAGRQMKGVGWMFTGRSVKQGGPGIRGAEHLADVFARRARFYSAQDLYDTLLTYSTDTRETEHQIPIRAVAGIPDELKRLQAEGENVLHMEPEENLGGLVSKIHNVVFPQDVQIPALGASVDGVQWVDSRLVKNIDSLATPSAIAKRFDTLFNQPARFLTVYARPAYIMNKVQNWTMLAWKYEARFPAGYKLARDAHDIWGDTTVSRMDAAMGQTRTASYIARRAKIGETTKRIQNFWQTVTDQTERRAALILQAEDEGYVGVDRIQQLVDDPANRSDLVRIARMARKNVVDFDSMTPAEHIKYGHLLLPLDDPRIRLGGERPTTTR